MAMSANPGGATGNGSRKQDHLRIVLSEQVDFTMVQTCLEQYYFVHEALPEIGLKNVDTSLSLFGKRLAAPIVISPMVGGIAGC